MKELVSIQKLLPVREKTIGTNLQKCISARELHKFLQVKSKFTVWIKNRIEKYGFIENQDFVTVSKNLDNGGWKHYYALSLDMAKELAMVENNDQGREAIGVTNGCSPSPQGSLL